MSSTLTLERPARQASPDPLADDAAPAISPLPLDPLAASTPGPKAVLAPASDSAPALADLLFTDIDIPSTPPAEGTEAQAAAPFKITDISTASWAAAKVLAAQARIAQRAELASLYKSRSTLAFRFKRSRRGLGRLPLDASQALHRGRALPHPFTLPDAPPAYGLGRLRKSPDHVSILDEAAAMAYLETHHPSAVVTKKTISLSTVRSLIFTQGEPVPGVEAALGSDSLYLKPRQ